MKGGGLARRYRYMNQRTGHCCVAGQVECKINQEDSPCGTAPKYKMACRDRIQGWATMCKWD